MTRPWKRSDDEALQKREDAAPATTSVAVAGGWGYTRPWKRSDDDEALAKRDDPPTTTVVMAGGWGYTRPWKRTEKVNGDDLA